MRNHPQSLQKLERIYALAGSSAGLSDALVEKLVITSEEDCQIILRFVDDPEGFLNDGVIIMTISRILEEIRGLADLETTGL
jgi:hypothetical protein